MEKNIYIIRHCKAEGQYPEATLTAEGHEQSKRLADFLSDLKIDRIISSPFLRARQTIAPFAEQVGMDVEIDSRLAERNLDPTFVSDGMKWMKESFTNLELRDAGDESGSEATERIAGVIKDICESDIENTMIVTHGGMITLLLKQYDESVGFDEWLGLSNPDVYVMRVAGDSFGFNRVWEDE